MELWDAYLEDGTLTNTKLVRGQKIPKGMFHLVSEVIVRHVDGSFLLMQRDYQKPNLPGMFEVSAGGSALVGENAYEAAVRELKEETGIITTKLEPIYTYQNNNTIYCGYLCITGCKKDSICLQKGETISYKWISKEELLHFVKSEQCSKHRT